MSKRNTIIITTCGLVAAAVGIGLAGSATAGNTDDEQPIRGDALRRATHTGGGEVTDTEVGDEDSLYEVEVRLPDGRSVDVQLDENFTVVDEMPDTDTGPDD